MSMNATWLTILKMDQTNVIKYGDEFRTPQRKQKFHAEKVSQDLFQLHILSVEESDQGKYLCAVEEWLLSTNGTWRKLGEKKSGVTELKLRPTGKPHVYSHTAFHRIAVFSWAALQWCDYVKVEIWPRVIGTGPTYTMKAGPGGPAEKAGVTYGELAWGFEELGWAQEPSDWFTCQPGDCSTQLPRVSYL